MHFPSLQAEAQIGDDIDDDGDGDPFGGGLALLSELVDSQVWRWETEKKVEEYSQIQAPSPWPYTPTHTP